MRPARQLTSFGGIGESCREPRLAASSKDEWHAHVHVRVQGAAAGILQFIRLGSVVLCELLADGGIYRQWAVGQPDKVFVLASYKQLSSVLRSSSEVLMISLLGLLSKMG